jgi:hypothetical protein
MSGYPDPSRPPRVDPVPNPGPAEPTRPAPGPAEPPPPVPFQPGTTPDPTPEPAPDPLRLAARYHAVCRFDAGLLIGNGRRPGFRANGYPSVTSGDLVSRGRGLRRGYSFFESAFEAESHS